MPGCAPRAVAAPDPLKVQAFTGGAFAENGYLAVCTRTSRAVAVDPGAASQGMADAIRSGGLELEAILLTHAHLDHVEGIHRVREVAPDAPIWLHPDDRPLWEHLEGQAAAFGMPYIPQPEPNRELVPGEDVSFGDVTLDVRFAPGHAPGHVIFVAHDHGTALVGDVIFQRSIGRTDLPGGDFHQLMASIREQVLTLPDEMVLLPGHGPATTVGEEREGNPFLVPHYGARRV